MSADDGAVGLLGEHGPGAEVEDRQRRRAAWVVSGVLAVVAVLVVVAVAVVVTSRPTGRSTVAAPASPSVVSAAPASSSAPTAEPAGAVEGPVVLQAPLSGGRAAGSFTVGVGAPVLGHAPPDVASFSTCGADPAALEYLPVQIREPAEGLDAALTVLPGRATPTGTGRLGFFFETGQDLRPCRPGQAWPTTDNFEATNGPEAVTGYVVLEGAVTAATPQGRPDVFTTLQLRVSRIVQLDSNGVRHPLTPGAPQPGALCPGTRTALCAPLG